MPTDSGSTPGISWRRQHLLRRRLTDVLEHADALERDVDRLLKEHEAHPERAALLHDVLRLRAELTELDRVSRTFARERGIDPGLPTPELRRQLQQAATGLRGSSSYVGPERRQSGQRPSDRP